tara:strand:- start:612 stop:902 length:291 start_codon:yes stop_codon:yes gene_type:complete
MNKIELTREELTTILQVATGNVKDFVMNNDNFIDKQLKAINYIPCCTELKDKKALTFEQYIDTYYERKDFKYFNKRGKAFKSTEILQIYDEHLHNL